MPMFCMVDGAPMKVGVTARGTAALGGAAGSLNFGTLNFGADAADRWIIAAVTNQGGGSLSACSIGGVAATILGTVNAAWEAGFAVAKIPSGASGNVTATFSGSSVNLACMIAAITGWAGSSFSVAAVANVNVPANSAMVGIAGGNGSALPGIAWSGLTADAYQAIRSGTGFGVGAEGAFGNFQNAQTPLALSVGISGALGSGSGRALFFN